MLEQRPNFILIPNILTLSAIFWLGVSLPCFASTSTQNTVTETSDNRISIVLTNQPIIDIVQNIPYLDGWVIEMDNSLAQKRISKKFYNVTTQELLRRLFSDVNSFIIFDDLNRRITVKSLDKTSTTNTTLLHLSHKDNSTEGMPTDSQLQSVREEEQGYMSINGDAVHLTDPMTGLTVAEVQLIRQEEQEYLDTNGGEINSADPITGLTATDVQLLRQDETHHQDVAVKMDYLLVNPLTELTTSDVQLVQIEENAYQEANNGGNSADPLTGLTASDIQTIRQTELEFTNRP